VVSVKWTELGSAEVTKHESSVQSGCMAMFELTLQEREGEQGKYARIGQDAASLTQAGASVHTFQRVEWYLAQIRRISFITITSSIMNFHLWSHPYGIGMKC
jgi:hypothetical protein